MRPAILIHGPTASGKTRLAIALAKKLDGEVINADAMQVYRDLNVLTARPDAEELSQAPHHLFGYIDASARYSAGAWIKEVTPLIVSIRASGRVPVVVGGTGLYLMALTEGLSEIPATPEAARVAARAKVAADTGAAWAELVAADPAAKLRIEQNDKQRIARALEVLIATGRPMSSFHGEQAPVLKPEEWTGVTLTPPREALYDRINTRVEKMMKLGALEEARALWSRKLESELPAMRAHGMPGFAEHFAGRLGLENAVERAKRDTRRYAKRQMTWIAHQFTAWTRVPSQALDVRTRVCAELHRETVEAL